MQRLIVLAAFTVFLPSLTYAESIFDVKVSRPVDGFTIGIPKHWNEKVYPSEKGTTYAYWDDIGNALTITVREPNSFERILTMIKNDQLNERQLKQLEAIFRQEAPLKQKVKISMELISNQRALGQSYLYRHEATGIIYFIKNKQLEFLKDGKQYQASFSPPPSKTEEAAEAKFNDSYANIFRPILSTLFLN